MDWIIISLCVILIQRALALTCLQCNGISQPRHCKFVDECKPGEACGVEKVTNAFGDALYNVGCIKESLCQNTSYNHQSSNLEVCRECCHSDLCNAQGCGEPGYPQNIGPICLSCQLRTHPHTCHTIAFCEPGHVCQHVVFREFGDTVYSSGCSTLLECKQNIQHIGTTIVGRDITSVQQESDLVPRTLTEHVCSGCCDKDLCNKGCNATAHVTDIEKCYNNSCVHGKCYENQDGYSCVCEVGYEGQLCENMTHSCQSGHCNGTTSVTDHCLSNPRLFGRCESTVNGFTCVCFHMYTGVTCNTHHCLSNPCLNGRCENIVNGFKCACDHMFTGVICDTPICVDTTLTATCRLVASIICQDKDHAQNAGCMHSCGFC